MINLKNLFEKKSETSDKADLIFAGLGNPGAKYAFTRHNIGWLCIDYIVSHLNLSMKLNKTYGYYAIAEIKDQKVLLLKPTTFMNASGEAIKYFAARFKVNYSNVVAVVDEYNFPVSKIHLKRGGSGGGHNGIASIIDETGTDQFLRLRCGIGKNFPPGAMVEYVLSNFNDDEIPDLELTQTKVFDALKALVEIGDIRAMSDINSGKLWLPQDSDSIKSDDKSII